MQRPCRRWLTGWMIVAALACARPAPEPAPAPVPPEPRVAPAPSACQRVVHIVVHKAARRLEARCAGGAVVEMTAAMGRRPQGAKRRQGDLRTPEGRYRIAGPPRPSRFHRFLPIDYPSVADAESAFAAGRLSAAERDAVVAAHAAGLLPPQDTALGGELGLHGESERWRGWVAKLDWTYGCVAVTDEEIEFLAERTAVGTPVEILP